MSTTSITHRPTSFVTAAAAVLALAAGGVALSASHQSSNPTEQSPHTQVQPTTPNAHHFHPTTSGGHVMLGQ
jgi:hypothetical protein